MPYLGRFAPIASMILALASPIATAGVELGAPFGDHMVIQRDRTIPIWGRSDPGSEVETRLGPRRGTAKADADGRWMVRMEPLPAGGPFELSAGSGGSKAEARDVMIGDVWLCSGQSNMAMTLAECDGGPEAADAASRTKHLRLASVGRRASAKPESTGEIRWRIASPKSARSFSGVGFFFGARLLEDPALKDVPIGLIDASFGGTMCEAWTPKEALGGFAPADLRLSMFGIAPSTLYNGMIAPLGRGPIRGAVWYQGEGNADRPAIYPKLLQALIGSWRERFETPEMPFIVIQLPDYAAGSGGLSWAWLREAQAKAVRETPHTALAVGIQTNDGFDLHPRAKREIGQRAALLALRDSYGRKGVANGPIFEKATPEGHSLRVAFQTSGDGLATRDGGPVRGFAVAGTDGRYFYADATIDGDSVVLRSEQVPAPATVRYAWAGAPEANLVGRSGLPAEPFRTDTLTPPDVDVQRRPVERQIQTRHYEATIDGRGSVTSLGIGGRQFVSNELGMSGGTCVPGWFGPRQLSNIREPGPGLVSCSDYEVDLLLNFGEDRMEWTVTNRSKDEVHFRISLSPRVKVGPRDASGRIEVSRDNSRLIVTSAEAKTDPDGSQRLEASVGGHSSKKLMLTIEDGSRASR